MNFVLIMIALYTVLGVAAFYTMRIVMSSPLMISRQVSLKVALQSWRPMLIDCPSGFKFRVWLFWFVL